MERKFVTFQNTQQVVKFVELAGKLDCDVDVKYGSRIVDGKSLLGVLSLAICKTVEVIFHSAAGCDPQLDRLFEMAS